MKKFLLVCIIIVGIAFVAGCIGGEKSEDSKTSPESQSSVDLINPTTLLKGYSSSEYTTYATSKMNSVEGTVQYNYFMFQLFPEGVSKPESYEGLVPEGKKHIYTTFVLRNDNGVVLIIGILQADSDSKYKESLSNTLESFKNLNNPDVHIETNLIGDYSSRVTFAQDEKKGGMARTSLVFSYRNYGVTIYAICKSVDGTICQTEETESLKVAKVIKSKLD